MNIFNSISARRPKRNAFNLSNEVKLSTNMGVLTPILCEEVVPGDKFRGSANALVRLAPMLAPMMHHVNVYTHFFFVPHRLVWDEWETFITGGPDGTSTPVFPRIGLTAEQLKGEAGIGTLADYLGIGSLDQADLGSGTLDVSALPFRGYQLIYNEYYRDQNLISPVEFTIGSGLVSSPTEVSRLLSLRNRAWEKDYFTASLPWAQRGPDVGLALGGQAPVYLKDGPQAQAWYDTQKGNTIGVSAAAFTTGGTHSDMQTVPFGPDIATGNPGITNVHPVLDPQGSMYADLGDGSGTTVNEFRRSIRIQEWLEKNARGGARYIEQILSHFGVRSSDARLQRPEFLGGGKSPIVISEVLQTSSTDTESPQANMAGHGISAHGSHVWSKNIEEHGYIIGIMSVLPRTAYQQGCPRHFRKFDKFDHYWPSLAHLGEQPVYQSEICVDQSNLASLDNVFGYVPRYAEYKYCASRVHGDFKDTLAFWHMGRIFTAPPNLNGEFVTSDPTTRIFAVDDAGDTHKLWIMIQNNVHAIRPMPKYGTPTI